MFEKKKKVESESRFIVKYKQTVLGLKTIVVLVDTETGVNYITTDNSGTELAPMLNSYGEPLIDEEYIK